VVTIPTLGLISGSLLVFFIVRNLNRTLSHAASTLSDGAGQVASAAGQVSSGSQSLASGSSEQAASLEETSASAEEITSMASATPKTPDRPLPSYANRKRHSSTPTKR
jgi:X-X-X-Leu-X-X-Gly heptad repeat protein